MLSSLNLRRGYAAFRTNLHPNYPLSRFPIRGPGASRARIKNPPTSEDPIPIPHEVLSSRESSQLWHESERPPGSNPGHGLKKLLGNHLLVIERCAGLYHPLLSVHVVITLAHVRQIEMLNIFLGFEQSNRYIISQFHACVKFSQ